MVRSSMQNKQMLRFVNHRCLGPIVKATLQADPNHLFMVLAGSIQATLSTEQSHFTSVMDHYWFTLGMLRIHSRFALDLLLIHFGSTLDLLKIYSGSAQDLLLIASGSTVYLLQIHFICTLDLLQICNRSALDLLQICHRSITYILQICSRSTLDLLCIQHGPALDPLQICSRCTPDLLQAHIFCHYHTFSATAGLEPLNLGSLVLLTVLLNEQTCYALIAHPTHNPKGGSYPASGIGGEKMAKNL
jgi:hypothetical protein